MISDRPYRKALSKKDAARRIKINARTQFDPNIAKFFIINILGEDW